MTPQDLVTAGWINRVGGVPLSAATVGQATRERVIDFWVIKQKVAPWIHGSWQDVTALPTHQPCTLEWKKGDKGNYAGIHQAKEFPQVNAPDTQWRIIQEGAGVEKEWEAWSHNAEKWLQTATGLDGADQGTRDTHLGRGEGMRTCTRGIRKEGKGSRRT